MEHFIFYVSTCMILRLLLSVFVSVGIIHLHDQPASFISRIRLNQDLGFRTIIILLLLAAVHSIAAHQQQCGRETSTTTPTLHAACVLAAGSLGSKLEKKRCALCCVHRQYLFVCSIHVHHPTIFSIKPTVC